MGNSCIVSWQFITLTIQLCVIHYRHKKRYIIMLQLSELTLIIIYRTGSTKYLLRLRSSVMLNMCVCNKLQNAITDTGQNSILVVRILPTVIPDRNWR